MRSDTNFFAEVMPRHFRKPVLVFNQQHVAKELFFRQKNSDGVRVARVPESRYRRHPGDSRDGMTIDFMSGTVVHKVPGFAVIPTEHRS